MDSFIFALNATLPVFLIILLGWALRQGKLFTGAFTAVANQYVFKVALPVSLFMSIAKMDIYTDFDPLFCAFCFGVTSVMFLGVWGITWLTMKDRTMVGAFSQASVRSSAAILGVALATNIYGNAGMVPMMILAAVPFFNIYAVLILTFSPHAQGTENAPTASGGNMVRKALKGIVTNPIIIGILLGVPFALLRIELPVFLASALNTVGGTASPIGLMVVGAEFSGMEALKKWKPAALATAVKLFLLPAIFLPIAALLGFHGSEMVAILILVGSPTTVACYVMAKSMHADTVLTSNVVVLATLLSSVSITLWIFLLRVAALL